MKARTFAAAAFVAAALLTSVGSGQSKGIGRPLTLRPAPVTNPVLGVSFGRLDTRLVRLDQRTLLPRGRGVSLERFTGAWSFSPDRRQLVFASAHTQFSESPAGVRLFEVSTLRRLRDLELGPSAEVEAVDWVAPERLLTVVHSCCPAASWVSLVDTATGAVLSRQAVEGNLVAVRRARGTLVLLLEPASFGPVRLAVAGVDGSLRTIILDQIRAGVSTSPPPASYLGEDGAGLAVDLAGGHAYVVAANAPIAQVDLASLDASYHTLAPPISLLGRLHDLLEPTAQAKTGALERSWRSALWLGDGRLAVFGRDGTLRWQDGRLEVRTRPSGLTVVDTSTWTSQVLDPRSTWAVVGRDALLSTGTTWDSVSPLIGNGLRVYGRDGAKRLQVFGSRALAGIEVFGSRAFVHRASPESDYSIVSLTTGRVLRTIHRDLPLVLRGWGS